MSDKNAEIVFHLAGGSSLRLECSSEVVQAMRGSIMKFLRDGGEYFSVVLSQGDKARAFALNRFTTYEFEYQRGFSIERTKAYHDIFCHSLKSNGVLFLSEDMEPLDALPDIKAESSEL
ncbi:hypothetical protein [Rothia sp. P4278]|uniref:hypothetical protein n=1 Tax=Rothia sp. P4278 TaxID=3402658 RepID=UPI003ADA3A64